MELSLTNTFALNKRPRKGGDYRRTDSSLRPQGRSSRYWVHRRLIRDTHRSSCVWVSIPRRAMRADTSRNID